MRLSKQNESVTNMDKVDPNNMEIPALELEPLPEQANDECYDGVMLITTQPDTPSLPTLPEPGRGPFRSFTFC